MAAIGKATDTPVIQDCKLPAEKGASYRELRSFHRSRQTKRPYRKRSATTPGDDASAEVWRMSRTRVMATCPFELPLRYGQKRERRRRKCLRLKYLLRASLILYVAFHRHALRKGQKGENPLCFSRCYRRARGTRLNIGKRRR